MPAVEFLNERRFDAFPFDGAGSPALLPDLFVDCNVVMGPASRWAYGTDVTLASITGNGSTLTVRLSTTVAVPGGGTTPVHFDFVFQSTDANYTTAYAEASLGAAYGFGFLTAGDLASTSYNTVATSGVKLLPQLVQTLFGHRVNSIRVANAYFTQFEDEECDIEALPTGEGYAIEPEVFTGDVFLRPGQSCQIGTVASTGEVIISPTDIAVGGDPGCEDRGVFPVSYNGGGALCVDSLYSFNGVGADPVSNGFIISGSQHVSVFASGPHEITIQFQPLTLIPADLYPNTSC